MSASPRLSPQHHQPRVADTVMRHIYQARCADDHLYNVITTSNKASIDPHVAGVIELLRARNKTSKTISAVLQRTLDSENLVAKQAVVLFALHAEPALRTWFAQNSNERVIAEFTNNILPQLVHAIMTGHFQTLKEFVDEARAEYVCI